MTVREFVQRANQTLVVLAIAGVVIYALMMVAYVFRWGAVYTLLSTPPAFFMFGLPISGVVAFAIVALLEALTSKNTEEKGPLSFKVFGLEFSGPAGPVTLWIAVYVTLVASMRLVE